MTGMFEGYSDIHIRHDPQSGCTFVIALNLFDGNRCSGGTRMLPYPSLEAGVNDAIRLAKVMSKKCRIIGGEYNGGFSGGKGVIIGNPLTQKTPEMLMRYGEFVNTLNGKFFTGTDLNIIDADAQYMAKTSKYIDGLASGPIDNTAIGTAYGLVFSMRSVIRYYLKRKSLVNVRVVIQGLGSVGMMLVELLAKEEAQIFVADISDEKTQIANKRFNAIIINADEVYDIECEIFSPNALGGILTIDNIKKLRGKIVLGSANNQLSTLKDINHLSQLRSAVSRQKNGALDDELVKNQVNYIPEFIVNCGGVYSAICEQRDKDKAYMLQTLEALLTKQIKDIFLLSKASGTSFNKSTEKYVARQL